LLLLSGASAVPAQDVPRGFPLDKTYRAISISGFDVQKSGLTLAVARGADGLKGSGSAGCNKWTATVTLRDDQIDFSEIVTTRMRCPKPRMTTEEAFLTSLKSARRWRQDGVRLILEGEAARLLLTAGAPAPEKKPSKKPAKPSNANKPQPRR
jgi:heat shock protein HslJ